MASPSACRHAVSQFHLSPSLRVRPLFYVGWDAVRCTAFWVLKTTDLCADRLDRHLQRSVGVLSLDISHLTDHGCYANELRVSHGGSCSRSIGEGRRGRNALRDASLRRPSPCVHGPFRMDGSLHRLSLLCLMRGVKRCPTLNTSLQTRTTTRLQRFPSTSFLVRWGLRF